MRGEATSTRDLVLIVTSGRMTAELEQVARATGARRVLRKPVDVTAIVEELGLATSLPASITSPSTPTG